MKPAWMTAAEAQTAPVSKNADSTGSGNSTRAKESASEAKGQSEIVAAVQRFNADIKAKEARLQVQKAEMAKAEKMAQVGELCR